MPAFPADAVDLHSVAIVLKRVLVGNHREHALQAFILELDHSAAALADEMLVMSLSRHGLVPLEALAEVMGAHQSALQQDIQSPVDCGGANPLALFSEPATNTLDREVIVGQQDGLCYEVSLSGDRQSMISKKAAETFKEGGPLTSIEVSHDQAWQTKLRARRTKAAVRHRSASGLPAAVA